MAGTASSKDTTEDVVPDDDVPEEENPDPSVPPV
jgi:hypothetical protein